MGERLQLEDVETWGGGDDVIGWSGDVREWGDDISREDGDMIELIDTTYTLHHTRHKSWSQICLILKTFTALVLAIIVFVVCMYYLEVKDYTSSNDDNHRHASTGGDGSKCDLQFVSRKEWGARTPKQPPTEIPPTNMTFLHHSAMPECSTKAECISNCKAIQDLHMDTRGWDDIGYNFLIGGDGRVYEGRGWQVQGAQAPSYNGVSHGICILGNYMKQMPTPAAIVTAKALITCGVKLGHIQAGYELFGHRDGRCTECPGDILYKDLLTWPHYSHRKIPIYCP